MQLNTFQITANDPVVARDGRPFGAGQGRRMRGLPWPLPSVVAGSLRSALVKADPQADFEGDTPKQLLGLSVAGVFPVVDSTLYLPKPLDCVWNSETNATHAVKPQPLENDCGGDFPATGLKPVMLTMEQEANDFKPGKAPAWWPMSGMEQWLLGQSITFSAQFLESPQQEVRDHVSLDAGRGAAAEGLLFATSGLNLLHLPRHGQAEQKQFSKQFAEISLSARLMRAEAQFEIADKLNTWQPLGGERRLVHWKSQPTTAWDCPEAVRTAVASAQNIRMVLATPAIFKQGWLPGWIDCNSLQGRPPIDGAPLLRLVGLCIDRWKAVSGWSLQPHSRQQGFP